MDEFQTDTNTAEAEKRTLDVIVYLYLIYCRDAHIHLNTLLYTCVRIRRKKNFPHSNSEKKK
jgi:hypothetical protein